MNNSIWILLAVFVCLLEISCIDGAKCSINENQHLLQELNAGSIKISLFTEDQGAFGSAVMLKVCNLRNDKLPEEISLRGEGYLPKIYHVEKDTIYIQYQFPRDTDSKIIDTLPFENIVLGNALINKSQLKYHYIFINRKPD